MARCNTPTSSIQSLIANPGEAVDGPPRAQPAAPAAGESREIRRLRAALRRERARGRCGHWSYDLTRHLALSQALKRAETAARAGAGAAVAAGASAPNTNARQADL